MEWGIATHMLCAYECEMFNMFDYITKPKHFVSFTLCDLINSIYRRGDIVSIDKRLYFNVLKDIQQRWHSAHTIQQCCREVRSLRLV